MKKWFVSIVSVALALLCISCSNGSGGNSNSGGGGGSLDLRLVGIWAENDPKWGYFFEFFGNGNGIEHNIRPDEGINEQILFEWSTPTQNQICIIGDIEFDGCNTYHVQDNTWLFKGGTYVKVESLPNTDD
jgi:hypothetical protein